MPQPCIASFSVPIDLACYPTFPGRIAHRDSGFGNLNSEPSGSAILPSHASILQIYWHHPPLPSFLPVTIWSMIPPWCTVVQSSPSCHAHPCPTQPVVCPSYQKDP